MIVARAFAPPSPKWKYAGLPFDPENSEHGTHVAGIAAGDNGTKATTFAGQPVSPGVAPDAYIGNYKALTIPTPGFGLDGNAPEIAKAIEQAVADGMDVINLSLGEPEIEQSRDIVVKAIDGAAARAWSRASPPGTTATLRARARSAPRQRAARDHGGRVDDRRGQAPDILAGFSSIGPAPYSLQLKPDVTAPGVNVVSSVPAREGTWAASAARAWPHRTSPAPRRCSRSGTPHGRSPRSSPR